MRRSKSTLGSCTPYSSSNAGSPIARSSPPVTHGRRVAVSRYRSATLAMSTAPSASAGHSATALRGGDWTVHRVISSARRRRCASRGTAGGGGDRAATLAATGALLGLGALLGSGALLGRGVGASVGAAGCATAARTLFEACETNQPERHVHCSPRVVPTAATTVTAATAATLRAQRTRGRPSTLRMAAFTVSTSTFRLRPANAVLSARAQTRLMTRGTPRL